MSEHLTREAVAVLDRYLDEVRAILRGAPVDVEEVVSDVRDHVMEAAAASDRDRMEPEELEEVLDRLGPPSRWLQGVQPREAGGSSPDGVSAGRLDLVVFGVTLLGLAVFPWVGPLLLVAAWALARWMVHRYESQGRTTGARAWLLYPPLILVSAALTSILLLWPVPPLFDLAGGGGPSVGAWARVIAGLGTWWVVLGLLVRVRVGPFRWLLYPLPLRPRYGVVLAGTGAVLVAGAILTMMVGP